MICENLVGPRVVCDVCQVADAGPQKLAEKLAAAELAAAQTQSAAVRAIDRCNDYKKLAEELVARGAEAPPGGDELEAAFKVATDAWSAAQTKLTSVRAFAAAVPKTRSEMLAYHADKAGFRSEPHPDHPERLRHVCRGCQTKGA